MRRLGCFGFLLVLGAFGFLFLVAQDWGGRGPAQRNITFDVGDGASLSTISSQLEEQGAIFDLEDIKSGIKVGKDFLAD